MEQLIKKSVEDMVKRLKNISWFEHCGDMNAESKYEISYAKDVNSVIKHCSSTRWSNLLLERWQDVSSYIDIYRVETKYPWDDVVELITKDILPEILDQVAKKWTIKYGESENVRIKVRSNLI
ncbi:hypothetical protein NL50_13085 [Clostridium acetobutylicum]|nr:hypothetical protein NL50_13085 [Clostridium acetobutylicum]